MIPFVLWTIINKCVHGSLSLKALWAVICEPTKGLWFLWVLFIISVSFTIGSWLSNRLYIKKELIHGVIAVLYVIMMAIFGIKIFGFQLVAYYFLFYIFGFYYHKYDYCIFVKKNIAIIFLSAIWAVLAWNWTINSVPDCLSGMPIPDTLVNYAYRFITAIVAIYLLFTIYPKYVNKPVNINTIFCYLGRMSLGVYTVHLIILGDVFKLVDYFEKNCITKIGLTFLILCGIAYGTVRLLSKSALTSKLMLGKV